jgi:hypothetical protein
LELSDFKDKHKGEIAFILGSGPSLHYLETDLIKDHVCIAVNSAIKKHCLANYFVSDDWDISSWSYYDSSLKRFSFCTKFLYRKKFEGKCDDLKDVVMFDHTWWYSPEDKSYNLDGLKLTKDEPLVIVGARMSMGSAVHLAFLMGCDPIVLLGNDCQLKNGKRYFWQFPGEQKQYRIKGRKFTHQTQNRGFNKDSFVEYWNYFAQVNEDSDVTIIDASDSCLDCFPKMSVREVLDKYKEK